MAWDLEQSLTGSDVVISVDQADVYVAFDCQLGCGIRIHSVGYDWTES